MVRLSLFTTQMTSGFQDLQSRAVGKAKASSAPLYYELNWILMQGLICQRGTTGVYYERPGDLDKVAIISFKWKVDHVTDPFGNL